MICGLVIYYEIWWQKTHKPNVSVSPHKIIVLGLYSKSQLHRNWLKKYLCKKNCVSTLVWSSNYGNIFKSFK